MKHIEAFLRKIPAALMVVPLLLGALVNTFFPQALEIGFFTTATFSSAAVSTIMGVQMVCLGSKLKLRSLPKIIAKTGTFLLSKLGLGFLCALIFNTLEINMIAGISILTLVAAITNINAGLYLSLTSLHNEAEAAAGTPILSLSSGPFLTLLVLGSSGFMDVSLIHFLAMLIPMIIGLILGNLSAKAEEFLASGVQLLIPFLGFSLGAGINLKNMISAGITGLFLALFVILTSVLLLIFIDRYLFKANGIAGIAASATGANSVMVPAAVATLNPEWESIAAQASAQLVTCAVLGVIIIPYLTTLLAKLNKEQRD